MPRLEKNVREMTLLEMCTEIGDWSVSIGRAEEIILEVRRRKFTRQFDPVIDFDPVFIDEKTDAMEGRR